MTELDSGREESSRWRGEICKRCNRRNPVGFQVPDAVWDQVHGEYNLLCVTCFDELAEQRGVEYEFQGIWPISWNEWAELQKGLP